MKKILLAISLLIFSLFLFSSFVLAETKEYSSDAPGRTIPKLPQTPNDPELVDGHVYPMWGPVCQRYTYSVVYKDKEGRAPKYVQIYFNGKMIDLEKENPEDNDYKKGVRYQYKSVPNKIGSNFYYFPKKIGWNKQLFPMTANILPPRPLTRFFSLKPKIPKSLYGNTNWELKKIPGIWLVR